VPSTTITKSRFELGALDTQLLFGSIDLGATKEGGAKLVYTVTYYPFEIDQSLTAPDVVKIKEEAVMQVGGLVQYQMNLIAAAFSTVQSGVGTVSGTPNLDYLYVGGDQTVPIGTYDFSGLRRGGNNLRLTGQLFAVYSAKPITIAFTRNAPTELLGVEFACLADMTRPVGQRLFTISRQYTAGQP
jgi:hypothetical protein